MTEAMRRLRDATGLLDDEIAFLADVDDADVRRLIGWFEQEKRRQADELNEAIEAGLLLVPRPLRKAVARVLVGFAG